MFDSFTTNMTQLEDKFCDVIVPSKLINERESYLHVLLVRRVTTSE